MTQTRHKSRLLLPPEDLDPSEPVFARLSSFWLSDSELGTACSIANYATYSSASAEERAARYTDRNRACLAGEIFFLALLFFAIRSHLPNR